MREQKKTYYFEWRMTEWYDVTVTMPDVITGTISDNRAGTVPDAITCTMSDNRAGTVPEMIRARCQMK